MSKNRKQLINKLINEGFTHRTLSLFTDNQLIALHEKMVYPNTPEGEKLASDKANETGKPQTIADDVNEDDDDLQKVTKNNEPEIEVNKDGKVMTLLGDGELGEDFASKAQQKYLYAVNPAAAKKLDSKMTKKDYENLPDKVTEQKMVENWILSLVEQNQEAEISKVNFLKTIQESKQPKKQTINLTKEQKKAFKLISEASEEMNPPMEVIIEKFNSDGNLKGFLKSNKKLIEFNISNEGGLKLGEEEVVETIRDEEGEYVGAPKSTTAPTPLKTPTIAPSKPGEKKRRGPFERPKTTPKPKAKNKSTLPNWLTSTNLGKALTQHG